MQTSTNPNAIRAENRIAMLLSIAAPGLGEVYKGHVAEGLLWLFLGMPIALEYFCRTGSVDSLRIA